MPGRFSSFDFEPADDQSAGRFSSFDFEPEPDGRFSSFDFEPEKPKEDSWYELGWKFLQNTPTMLKQTIAGRLQLAAETDPAMPNMWIDQNDPAMAAFISQHREGVKKAREEGTLPGQQMYDEATADLLANAPNVNPESAKNYAYDIATGITQMLPTIAASLVTRNPAAGVFVLGQQVAGQSYGESRAKGRSIEGATADAMFDVFAEALPEAIPLGMIMKPGERLLSRTLKSTVGEAIQESVTEVLQRGYDAGVLDEEMTWGEAAQAVIHAGIVGAAVGGGLAVAAHPFTPAESQGGQVGALQELYEKRQRQREGGSPVKVEDIDSFTNRRIEELQSLQQQSGQLDDNGSNELNFLRQFQREPELIASAFGVEMEPMGERERASRQTPELTESDRASPIPNDILQRGKEIVNDAYATGSANDILRDAGFPEINSRIYIEGNETPATVTDAFVSEDGGHGVKLRYDDGRYESVPVWALKDRIRTEDAVLQEAEQAQQRAEEIKKRREEQQKQQEAEAKAREAEQQAREKAAQEREKALKEQAAARLKAQEQAIADAPLRVPMRTEIENFTTDTGLKRTAVKTESGGLEYEVSLLPPMPETSREAFGTDQQFVDYEQRRLEREAAINRGRKTLSSLRKQIESSDVVSDSTSTDVLAGRATERPGLGSRIDAGSSGVGASLQTPTERATTPDGRLSQDILPATQTSDTQRSLEPLSESSPWDQYEGRAELTDPVARRARVQQPNMSRAEFEKWVAKPPAFGARAIEAEKLTPEIADTLRWMDRTSGWAEVGGRAIREAGDWKTMTETERLHQEMGGAQGEVVDRTKWLPKQDWWAERPFKNPEKEADGRYNEAETSNIIKKGIEGKYLGTRQREYFDWLTERAVEINERVESTPTEEDFTAHGLEYDEKVAADAALVAQAEEIDESAVERAATRFADDDAGFLEAIRGIIDSRSAAQTAIQNRPGAQTGQEATTDLLGDDTTQAQALADRTRALDRLRNTGQESVETGDAGDMFSQARQQTDLVEAVRQPSEAAQAAQETGTIVLDDNRPYAEQGLTQSEALEKYGPKAINDLVGNDSTMAYRSMSQAEYEATVAAGKGVVSDGRWRAQGERTNFAEDFFSAAGYQIGNRTDPRATGEAVYVVEAPRSELQSSRLDRGNFEGETDQVRRVWRVEKGAEGQLVATPVEREVKAEDQFSLGEEITLEGDFTYTDEAQAKLDEIEKTLRERLQQVGISDRVVGIATEIIRDSRGRELPEAAGRYKNRVIEIALSAKNPLRTINHEIIHALRDLGVIRDGEWNALSRAAQRDANLMKSVQERYGERGLKQDKMTEEAVADLHALWDRGEYEARGFLKKAFERVRNFFEAVKFAWNKHGFKTWAQVKREAVAKNLNVVERAQKISGEVRDYRPAGEVLKSINEGELGQRPSYNRNPSFKGEIQFALNRPNQRQLELGRQPNPNYQSPWKAENDRIREADKTVWVRAKALLKRQLTSPGLLPEPVFDLNIQRNSNLRVVEFDVEHLIGLMENNSKSEFGKAFRNLPDVQKIAINEALTGRMPQNMPAEMRRIVVAMRQYIDNLSGVYVDMLQRQMSQLQAAGASQEVLDAKQGLIDTIISNEGEYLHRSYQVFDDPDWYSKLDDEVIDDARRYLMNELQQRTPQMPNSVAERRADAIIEDMIKEGTAYDSLEHFVQESKLGAKDLSILKKRQDLAPEIRALLGEYIDPRINFAKTATKMSRLIFNTQFLEQVKAVGMGGFLFTEDNRPPNTTKIAADSSEVYSPLNGLYTFRDVKQGFIDALGKEKMENWYRTIIQINGAIKFGKTVLSPTTAARNWQSAAFFAMANGHFDMRQLKHSVSGLKEYFTHSGSGAKLNYLRRLQELGVVYDTAQAGEMMRLLEDSNLENMFSQSKTAMKARDALKLTTRFYQYGDDFWKIFGFENEKNNLMKFGGMTLAEAEVEAAERIRNTYPTYSMVPRGIQQLRRFPLAGTFVSFPAEIIRTSKNIMKYAARDMKNPQMRPIARRRIAGMAMASGMFAALAEVSKQWFGIDDDDDEAVRLQAAPWNENSTLMFTGRDDDGNLRYIDLSFLDPYNYFKRPLNAIMREQPWEDAFVDAAKEMLLPFFGVDIAAGTIFEVISNKRSSGSEIYADTDPPWLISYKIGEHILGNVQPGLTSNMFRTWKAIKGETNASGRKYDLWNEGLGWIGWRVSTLDPKTALHYRSFTFNDARSDANRTLTRVLQDPNDISESDIATALSRGFRMRGKAYEEMGRIVGAARRSGLSPADIQAVLSSDQVSQADIDALIAGRTPAWELTQQSEDAAARKAETLLGAQHAREIRRRYAVARRQMRQMR